MESYQGTSNERDDHKKTSLARRLPMYNKEFDVAHSLKFFVDVINDLNDDQKAIAISIGFGSLLKLAASSFPQDVFNWLAKYIDATTGWVDLPNGFSFIINRDCIRIILDKSEQIVSKKNCYENKPAWKCNASTYGLSLNERLLGHPVPKPSQDHLSEFPSYSLGEEFEENYSPTTPIFQNINSDSNKHSQFQKTVHNPYATYQESISTKTSNGSDSYDFHYSGDEQKFYQNQKFGIPSDSDHGLQSNTENRSFLINKDSSHNMLCRERSFRPLSMKHVKSDNTLSPPECLFQDSRMDFSGLPSASVANKKQSKKYTRDFSAAHHLEFDNTGIDEEEPSPSETIKKHKKVSFASASFVMNNSNSPRPKPSHKYLNCTVAEEELFSLLTTNITEIVCSNRIFQIEERWTDERMLARCMSHSGYMNEYVMNAFVKMILFDQKMKDMHGEKFGFVKHITYSEITECLMNQALDISTYKDLFREKIVGFRLEHAGLVHIPCTITKQWFLIVANFMDKCFDVLNPSQNTDLISDATNDVVHNFKELFSVSYPHCPNFNIFEFKVRHVDVPKQNFKFDSGFFILLFMQFYNGLEVPNFSNDDLPAIKRKPMYQIVTNKYNTAKQSKRIKDFIVKYVPVCW